MKQKQRSSGLMKDTEMHNAARRAVLDDSSASSSSCSDAEAAYDEEASGKELSPVRFANQLLSGGNPARSPTRQRERDGHLTVSERREMELQSSLDQCLEAVRSAQEQSTMFRNELLVEQVNSAICLLLPFAMTLVDKMHGGTRGLWLSCDRCSTCTIRCQLGIKPNRSGFASPRTSAVHGPDIVHDAASCRGWKEVACPSAEASISPAILYFQD